MATEDSKDSGQPNKKAKMDAPKIVSRDEWIQARKDLLVKEKELSKAKAALAKQRQEMPWEKVQDYALSSASGKTSKLSDLFGDKDALIVWHFMYFPGGNSCHHCGFFLDGFNGIYEHLKPRASFCAVSSGPADELEKIKSKKGWTFPVVSCKDSNFGQDFGVVFSEDDVKNETAIYNYGTVWRYGFTAPGLSVFQKKTDVSSGETTLYHTYSTYAAGLADFNATFNLLDVIPEGRNEDGKHNMWWVKHKEEYGKDEEA